MDKSLITAIDSYYKLKQKYEKQFDDYKNRLRKNETMNKAEKRRLFSQFQPKCVNCAKVGGTIFTNTDRVLKATCGATEPCKLNIELSEGKYASVISLDENYSKNVDTIKTKIIMTKLDFLFGYISDESVAFENFDKLRKNLGQYMEAQLLIQKRYNEVAHNPEKTEAINVAIGKLYEEIIDVKNIYKLYLENPRDGYITDMVEKYINVLQPLADKIRDMKYVVNVIEKDDTNEKKDDTFYLIQKAYTAIDLEQEVYGTAKSGIVKNVM
uniref:Uncharacterized protein n=1 Tax=viral metagenome TaxID=1070528 RepID=A0A6C0ILU0_9ZZZZ